MYIEVGEMPLTVQLVSRLGQGELFARSSGAVLTVDLSRRPERCHFQTTDVAWWPPFPPIFPFAYARRELFVDEDISGADHFVLNRRQRRCACVTELAAQTSLYQNQGLLNRRHVAMVSWHKQGSGWPEGRHLVGLTRV